MPLAAPGGMDIYSTPVRPLAARAVLCSAIAITIAAAVACADDPNAPTAPTVPTAIGTVPVLLEPESQAYFKQNDPATGCRQDPVWGYGYQVAFSWSAVRDATGYRIFMMHPLASVPLVDEIVSGTRYERRRCTEILGHEQGWQWKVRAVLPGGQEGAWSEVRTINFTRGYPDPPTPPQASQSARR
jgi:hypothetical protein